MNPCEHEDLATAVSAVRREVGTVSVVARVSGEADARVGVAPDAQHYSASIMKLPILIAAHRRAERGEVDLDQRVSVHDEVGSVIPGVRFRVDPAEDSDPQTWAAVGRTVPLRELVERMVTVSGNLATNLVLESVGLTEVAEVLAEAGCSPRTQVVRGIEDYAARDAGTDNLVTADDLTRLLVALAEGRLAGTVATAACEDTLRAQTYRDGIPAGLPSGLVVANKTGWIDGVSHDVALVRAPGRPPVGIAVLVTAPGSPAEREAGIARLTRALWPLVGSDPGEGTEPDRADLR